MLKDPYLSDHHVLKNKLGIKDQTRLDAAEAAITKITLYTLKEKVKGRFDYKHLMNIHKHIFGDLYEWAGSPRTIDISKPEKVLSGLSVPYEHHANIKKELTIAIEEMHKENWQTFKMPEEQAEVISKHLSKIWEIHPFREGNTRTIMEFMIQFMESKNIMINRQLFGKNAVFTRNALVVASFGQDQHIKKIMKDAIGRE